jgi:IPT/TIG domain/Right handed beta helix region
VRRFVIVSLFVALVSLTPAALCVAASPFSAEKTVAPANALSVRDLSPAAGQYGDVVTLTGAGFTGVISVRFNGVDALAYTVISDTTMIARVPKLAAQSGPITVSSGKGLAASQASFMINTAAGPVYWVSPTGNDRNSGDYTHPFATLKRADRSGPSGACGPAGTHIHVLPGSYTLSSSLATCAAGTASAPVIYISDMPYGARLDMAGDADWLLWEMDGDYEQVIGFDLTASGASVRSGILADNDLIARNHIHDIYREGCHDSSIGGAGINVIGAHRYASSAHIVIDSNVIENVGARLKGSPCQNVVQGVYVATSDNIVTNNIVRYVSGYGIHAYHNPNRNVIANNDIDHSGEAGILLGADDRDEGGIKHTAMNNVVANNISRDNGRNGDGVGYGIQEYTVEGPTGYNSYLNNDLFNNANKSHQDHNPYVSSDTDRGEITDDPHYVDYAGKDYHLQHGSLAANNGTSTGAPSRDFDQVPRPQGPSIDIGAYESQ